MAAFDELPPDQRAVLQLVVAQGRSYEEISRLLGIERAAVRARALAAVEALVGSARDPELTDFLLAQSAEPTTGTVRDRLAAAGADRDWALAAAAALEPLRPGSAFGVPVGAPLGADSAVEDIRPPSTMAEPTPSASAPRVSRRGGALLLGAIGVVVVAAIVFLGLHGVSGGSSDGSRSPRQASTSTLARTIGARPLTRTTAARTTTGASAPRLLSALNLTAPGGSSKAVGVAQVLREGGTLGILVEAQGLAANSAHDAYGVWLYNSATSLRFVGFVPKLVGRNGRLEAAGRLPADASSYSRLLITLETSSKPLVPGRVVLAGPFHES